MKKLNRKTKKIISYGSAGVIYALVLFSLPTTVPVIVGTNDGLQVIPKAQTADIFSAADLIEENIEPQQAPETPEEVTAEVVKPKPKPTPQPIINDPYNPNIEAKAAFVYDVTAEKSLYEKNENSALPLASLTKIMTAITAASIASPLQEVSIHAEALNESGDSGLLINERWSLRDLLRFTLVVSSNDGAAAIAMALGQGNGSAISNRAEFVKKMNEKAYETGLTKTHFLNESGLDQKGDLAGAYGSARDVALLLEYALKNNRDIIEATKYPELNVTSLDSVNHIAKNTDIIVNKIPNLLAGKTGYTVLAGGNLAVAFNANNGHTIIVVVLGSSYDGRFNDVENLVTFSRTIISQNSQ